MFPDFLPVLSTSLIEYYDGGTVRLNTEFYSWDTSFGLVNPRLRYSCGQVVFCVNLGSFFKCFLQLGWRRTGVRSTLTEGPLNVPWMFPECSLNVPWMFPECPLNVPWMQERRDLAVLLVLEGAPTAALGWTIAVIQWTIDVIQWTIDVIQWTFIHEKERERCAHRCSRLRYDTIDLINKYTLAGAHNVTSYRCNSRTVYYIDIICIIISI
jgi:hypothetical protein